MRCIRVDVSEARGLLPPHLFIQLTTLERNVPWVFRYVLLCQGHCVAAGRLRRVVVRWFDDACS